MMNTSTMRMVRVACALCVLLGALHLQANVQGRSPEPKGPGAERERLGVWSAPSLPGFERWRSDASILRRVNYRAHKDGARLFLKVVHIHAPDIPPLPFRRLMRDTVAELQRDSGDSGYKSHSVKAWRVTFRGLPAFRVERGYEEGGQRVRYRLLAFRDGQEDYQVHMVLRGNLTDQAAKEHMDAAWRLLIDGLQREDAAGAVTPK